MAQPSALFVLLTFVAMITTMNVMSVGAKQWCVARKDVGDQQLMTSLKYACANGADCKPIQPGGICFNPNTIQNHASYALIATIISRVQKFPTLVILMAQQSFLQPILVCIHYISLNLI